MKLIGMTKDFYSPNRYRLDAYPAGKQKLPFAVICPGGGYATVASSIEGKPYALELNKRGYHAFVLRYRTKKKALYPAPMDDLASAVKYIMENAEALHVGKEGYSVWGSSAGGHLAASFGTKNMGYQKYGLPKPAALILCYPVITMGGLGHTSSRKHLLGVNPLQTEIDFASVEQQIPKEYPPVFFWFSRKDKTVSPENGDMLEKSLKRSDIPYQYLKFESGKHGSGLSAGTEREVWFDRAIEFWDIHRSKSE